MLLVAKWDRIGRDVLNVPLIEETLLGRGRGTDSKRSHVSAAAPHHRPFLRIRTDHYRGADAADFIPYLWLHRNPPRRDTLGQSASPPEKHTPLRFDTRQQKVRSDEVTRADHRHTAKRAALDDPVILAAGCFVGMEWLFFLTKPSFLNAFTWAGRLGVFGAALLPVIAAGGFVLVVLRGAARIPISPVQLVSRLGMRALPSLVLWAAALLLVDNFTTTLFGWGIASLRGGRLPYAAGVLIAL